MTWTYIFDELPTRDVEVLWCNPSSGIMIIGALNDNWDGELGDEYFRYWMPLPKLPEVKSDGN